jgi:hypothetical protein
VTLTGGSWQPGESVQIDVNEEEGQVWSRSVDVTASDSGDLTDQFTLPDTFVANYVVRATGASGATASATFTDAALKVYPAPQGSAVSFTLTYQGFTNSTCTSGGGGTATVVILNDTGGDNINTGGASVLSGKSFVKFTAPAGATTPSGWTFKNWASHAGSDNVITTTTSASICVRIPAGGNNDGYDATYQAPPTNAAPTVGNISGDTSANEGQTKPYTYTATEPEGETITNARSDTSGNASISGSSTNSSVSVQFTDGPSTVGLQVVVDDGHGHTVTRTLSITENNVAPTVTLSGAASADEGQTKTYTYTVSDPGADPSPTVTESCGANGTRTDTLAANSFDCTFPDGPASSTVGVTADDGDPSNNTGSDSIVVTVANVAPTVTLSGAASADEGQTKTYTYTVSDPGADPSPAVTESCGANGTRTDTLAANSFDCTFPDGPASSTVEVTADDGDPSNNTGSDSIVVTVANVAPTVAFAAGQPASADEGQTKSYSYTVSDPGADTFSVAAGFPDCGAGNTVSDESTSAGGGSFKCTFADGPSSPHVRIKVADSDGAPSNTDELVVTVANVAPTVVLAAANDLGVNEGSTHTYSYSISDPGADTVSSVTTNCGGNGSKVSGSDTNTDTSGSFQCTFPDGPASSIVSASATDSDGATGAADTQSVTVNNVAPTVTLSGAASADEGQTKTYTYTVSDPGDDPSPAITESCGAHGTRTDTAAANSFDCTFPDGPASSTVEVTADDGDPSNNTGSDSIVVAVANVAPTAVLANGGPVDEGSPVSVSFSSQSDPSAADTSAGFHYAYACDNGSLAGATYGGSGTSATKSCTFNDNGTKTVRARIIDKDGGYTEYTTDVSVNNVAPTITSVTASSQVVPAGGTSNITASFTDPGTADTHTCVVNWDGATGTTPMVTETNGSGTCKATGTFATPGVYSLTVTITDDDGGSTTSTVSVLIAVYDPNAGFVTGGGWINSPAGAYRADVTLAGRANFGFNAKYQKGANVPTGSTEFQFQVGNLNFHSESYDWLVVSGSSKAQYKGKGQVNGETGYGYLLTANDGSPDRFRIKIWKLSDSSIVYDNNYGAPDDIDTANPLAIAGGSIVIHK